MQLLVQNRKAIFSTLVERNYEFRQKRKEKRQWKQPGAETWGREAEGFLQQAQGVCSGLTRKVTASANRGDKGPSVWGWLSELVRCAGRETGFAAGRPLAWWALETPGNALWKPYSPFANRDFTVPIMSRSCLSPPTNSFIDNLLKYIFPRMLNYTSSLCYY